MKYLPEIIAAVMVASMFFVLYGKGPALLCLLVMTWVRIHTLITLNEIDEIVEIRIDEGIDEIDRMVTERSK